MPDLDDIQTPNQDPNQQLSLTGDDLAALHGVARQLQAAGDPRVDKLWRIIASQSGGGDGTPPPKFTLTQSPLKTTSWRDDLEKELWGDAAGNNQPAARSNAPVDDEDDSRLETDGTGATADFLDDLSGIGLHAYLAMRDPELPGYKDWRAGNFVRDGLNFVSREGEAYTNDELKQVHQVLSHQAGNPLISNMFIGPKFKTADYLVWRNQNFGNDGGPWQDDDGTIYSEPAMQELFGAKFAAQPGDPSATPTGSITKTDGQEDASSDDQVKPPQTGPGPAQSDPLAWNAFMQSLDAQKVGRYTVGELANVLTNESRDLSFIGPSAALFDNDLDQAKYVQAHAIINNAMQDNPNEMAHPWLTKGAAASRGRERDIAIMRQAYFDRMTQGADPAQGRTYFGNSAWELQSRKIGSSRQTPFARFGPFALGSQPPRYIYVFNDPIENKKR